MLAKKMNFNLVYQKLDIHLLFFKGFYGSHQLVDIRVGQQDLARLAFAELFDQFQFVFVIFLLGLVSSFNRFVHVLDLRGQVPVLLKIFFSYFYRIFALADSFFRGISVPGRVNF